MKIKPAALLALLIIVSAALIVLTEKTSGPHKTIKATDYSGQNLAGCDFRNADIWNSVFDGANLEGCDFSNAKIYDTSFLGSSLAYSSFANTWIVKSTFKESNLVFANFSGATLLKNNLGGARLSSALFSGANLTENRGNNVIGDKTIMLATIRNLNDIRWTPFHDRFDYDLMDQNSNPFQKFIEGQFSEQRNKSFARHQQVLKAAEKYRRGNTELTTR